MKKLFLISICQILLFSVLFAQMPKGYPVTDRTKTKLNTSWKFQLGNPEAANFQKNLDDSNWEEVSIPHSLKLTSIALDGVQDDKFQKTFQREVGWYRKTIKVTPDASKKVFIYFEGVHQVTDLWVNGKHAGQHAVGGYTPFQFDISGLVNYGKENQIPVLVADNG